MHIGFFGHSAASWAGDPRSFIDQMQSKIDFKICNLGVPQGCEERIFFDLTKTKKIDIAIIFHSSASRFIFLPKCNRDVSIRAVPENKAQVLWSETFEDKTEVDIDTFSKEFMGYGGIREVFETPENFANAMKIYKKYFWHPDLEQHRMFAARAMIDGYCLSKKINVIHIESWKMHEIPEWSRFKSGVSPEDLRDLVKSTMRSGVNPNNVTDEGNRLLADRLVEIIKENRWHES